MSRALRISDQADAIAPRAHDGYWGLTVRDRVAQVRRLAAALERVVLLPYVPARARVRTPDGWLWQPRGLVRATSMRALREWVGEFPADPRDCVAAKVLRLVDAAKAEDPSLRWADLARLAAWPIALRVDAKRLGARIGPLARATWCVACDDAPWASRTRHCLWCERIAPPPVSAASVEAATTQGRAA